MTNDRALGRVFSSIFSALFFFLAIARAEATPKADIIVHHAKIFTADPQRPWAQAVAIKGKKVMAVGTNSQVLALAHPWKTHTIHAGGRTVVPGINDAHVHVLGTPGVLLNADNLAFIQQSKPGPSLTEVLDLIAAATQSLPPGTWLTVLVGENVDDDDGATRFALDTVSPNHPVWLQMWTGHGTFVNSKALEVLGIGDDVQDPMGGHFDRAPGTSILTGKAHEYAEHMLRRRLLKTVSNADLVERYQAFATAALARGVTSIQDMPIGLGKGRALDILEAADLPIRVRSICFPLSAEENCHQGPDESDDGMITSSGVKWIADGTPIERRAFVNSDYSDDPGNFGVANFDTGTLEDILLPGLCGSAKKRQRLVHTVGDGSIQRLLEAVDATGGAQAWNGRRLRMEHGDLLFPENFQRIKDAGIVVVQNPTHLALQSIFEARFDGRMDEAQPLQSLLDADIPLAFGSDSFGAPPNPWLDVMMATIHPTRGEAEAIGVGDAIIAYTRTAAYAEFTENKKGQIRADYLADLAILSQDPFAAPPGALPGTSSVLTLVNGDIRWNPNNL